MNSLFLLAVALTASVDAPEAPPTPACQALDADLPSDIAAWRSPASLSGAVHPGTAVRIAMRPPSEVQTVIPPHGARAGGATTAARLDLDVATSGTYRIALDPAAWIDLIRDGAALRSSARDQAPACSSIRKVVDFALTSGRYTIQLSGTTAASVRLLVIPR